MTAAEQINATAIKKAGKAVSPLKFMRQTPNAIVMANEIQMPHVPIIRAVLSNIVGLPFGVTAA